MQPSCTFVIPSHGKPKLIAAVQSSMPRSDLVVMKTVPSRRPPLTSLPLSPFPLAVGSGVLTHLFGSPDVPDVVRARNRRQQEPVAEPLVEEAPISWLEGKAWRRWGRGELLGYRSYTGQEVEVRTVRIDGHAHAHTVSAGWHLIPIASPIDLDPSHARLVGRPDLGRQYGCRRRYDKRSSDG